MSIKIYGSLFQAIEQNDIEQVKQLILQNKKLIDMPNMNGDMPLHFAIRGHDDIAELLIDNGAYLNKEGSYRGGAGFSLNGNTPLHQAAFYGRKKMIHLLIREGVYPFTKNRDKKTALDLVKSSNHFLTAEDKSYTISLLQKYMEAFIEAKDNPTEDTLHKLIEVGCTVLVKPLLAKFKPSLQQIYEYGKLARTGYEQTSNNASKKMGQLLRAYAAIVQLQGASLASGAQIPADITLKLIDHVFGVMKNTMVKY